MSAPWKHVRQPGRGSASFTKAVPLSDVPSLFQSFALHCWDRGFPGSSRSPPLQALVCPTPAAEAKVDLTHAPCWCAVRCLRFRVASALQPRNCSTSEWSNVGWCAFDNNLAVVPRTMPKGSLIPGRALRFLPKRMKCPISARYRYFRNWIPFSNATSTPRGRRVQFLSVRFEGQMLWYITKDPEITWGGAA